MPASSQLATRVRDDRNFKWLESPSYVDETLAEVLSLIDSAETWVDSAVAWETRTGDAATDGRVSFFVLTNRGLYFPVTRRSWRRARHQPVAVAANDLTRARAGRSQHGFLTLDLFDERGEHRAGITFHPMASGGQEAEQAQLLARTLGVRPDTFE